MLRTLTCAQAAVMIDLEVLEEEKRTTRPIQVAEQTSLLSHLG